VSWQQVISESPYLTFFLIVSITTTVFHCIFRCWNRFLRCMNIRKNGWPPPHCDADGDYPPRRAKDKRVDE
jgi:hypothetical protein